jgi:hypothetical protein
MSDPRAENCTGYREQNGLIMGVLLDIVPVPSTKYELVRVELIDEPTNGIGGPTVAWFEVLTKEGIPTAERVVLAYPWPDCSNVLNPGTAGQHMITNGYNPPNRGPLALYPVDGQGNVIGDKVGGLGLPFNHHVSYRATWRERGGTTPDPDPEPGGDNTEVVALLREIRDAIRAGFRL